MSKVVVGLLATSVGLGLLSVHLVRQMKAGEATIAELQAKVATLEKQRPQLQEQPSLSSQIGSGPVANPFVIVPVNPEQPSKSVTFKGSATAATTTANVAQPQIPSREERLRMMREHRERQRLLMQDPEYREALRIQARSNFGRSYPGLVEELGLDTKQADEFFGMLSDQQMRSSEQMEGLWDMEGKDPAMIKEQQRKIQQQAAELQRTGEAEIAARFGQEKLQAWKEYQSTLGVRHQLESMRTTLAGQGVPLSDDSNKAMLKALAEVQRTEADEYSAAVNRGVAPRLAFSNQFSPEMVENQIEASKKRNQRVLDALSPYLSYEQRSALEKEQQAQLKVQEAQMRIMRAQGAANANALYPVNGLYPVDPTVQAVITSN
jgi:hypothetical protein